MDEKQRVSGGDALHDDAAARVEKALDAVEQWEEKPQLDRRLNRKFDLQ